jgi:hypothetical protein
MKRKRRLLLLSVSAGAGHVRAAEALRVTAMESFEAEALHLNTGLQDAYNLGWKLALVVQGKADAALLDSYEAERMPVAQRLLKSTDRAFKLVVSDNPLAGLLRTQVIARIAAFAMSRKRIQAYAFRLVSQTGIHYRKGPLSEDVDRLPEDAPQAGDRFPWLTLKRHAGGAPEDLFQTLDDTRFHLLVFGQPAPPELTAKLDDLLEVHAIPIDPVNGAELARARIPQPSFYLLRPDGHVGLCGRELPADGVVRYLHTRVTLR